MGTKAIPFLLRKLGQTETPLHKPIQDWGYMLTHRLPLDSLDVERQQAQPRCLALARCRPRFWDKLRPSQPMRIPKWPHRRGASWSKTSSHRRNGIFPEVFCAHCAMNRPGERAEGVPPAGHSI